MNWKESQPNVQINFMNGLDSRNIENSLIQNDQKKQAKTCKQSKDNSRHMSPNYRSQGKEDNMRARSFQATDLNSQSIKSGQQIVTE